MVEAPISLIAALSINNVIGVDNKLPWNIPEDLARFKDLTLDHVVVMGRRTFESVGQPLPKRINIVVSHDPSWQKAGVEVAHSIPEALARARELNQPPNKEIFIIGGGQIYKETIDIADRLYLTIINEVIKGDTSFPDYQDFREVSRQEGSGINPSYAFVNYVRS